MPSIPIDDPSSKSAEPAISSLESDIDDALIVAPPPSPSDSTDVNSLQLIVPSTDVEVRGHFQSPRASMIFQRRLTSSLSLQEYVESKAQEGEASIQDCKTVLDEGVSSPSAKLDRP